MGKGRVRGQTNGRDRLIANIANILTIYRIAAAPVAAWMAFAGHRDAFFLIIIVSLATDLIDGPIARWLGQASALGARLDTIADANTVLAGLVGLYLLEGDSLRPELPWLVAFLISYAIAAGACLAKFRRVPAYHLYLSKAAAAFSAGFFVWFYLVDYSRPFFIGVLMLGVLANCESVLATLRLQRFRADIRSLLFLSGKRHGRDT